MIYPWFIIALIVYVVIVTVVELKAIQDLYLMHYNWSVPKLSMASLTTISASPKATGRRSHLTTKLLPRWELNSPYSLLKLENKQKYLV